MMKNTLFVNWLCTAILLFIGQNTLSSVIYGQQTVKANQVNGTWKRLGKQPSEIKILAIGRNRLIVEISALYKYETPSGPIANIGEGSGIAFIDKNIAEFVPQTADIDECTITLRFTGDKLIVNQRGICGFGKHVSVEGIYHCINHKKPKFTQD